MNENEAANLKRAYLCATDGLGGILSNDVGTTTKALLNLIECRLILYGMIQIWETEQ